MFHVKHPPASAAAFQQEIGCNDAAIADLEQFRDLLGRENAKLNLVGPSAMATFWPRHAFDSAQLIALAGEASTYADLGAGAGFPGVVLAILLKPKPDSHVHLVDSLAKRCRFLQTVVEALDLPATVHNRRAESFEPALAVDIVTARACAPLAKLFDYAFPFTRAGARGLFLKGRSVEAEMAEARKIWRFDAELLPSLSDPEGRIVRVEALARARSDRRARG